MIRRLLLLCLLLAPAAAAQVSEAKGIAEVKAAAKLALKDYKAATKEAGASLETALGAVDAGIDGDSTAAEVVNGVGAALEDWLAASDQALFLATGTIGESVAIALDHMQIPTLGDVPATLGYGSAGVLDDALAQVRKAAAKTRNAVEKRVRKTMARAGKEAGLAMSLVLQHPHSLDLVAIETDDAEMGEMGAEMELVLAGSRLDTDSDGVVYVVGNSDFGSPDVELALIDANDATVDNATAIFLAGPFTFAAVIDEAGGGLDEGIYLVTVSQGDAIPRGLIGIHVR